MGDVSINVDLFLTRTKSLLAAWKAAGDNTDFSPLDELGSILLVAGNSDESNPYRKTSAVQTYLLGYEFPSTLMLITPTSVLFVCSESKAKVLRPLEGDRKGVKVMVEVKPKDPEKAKTPLKGVLDAIAEAGKALGVLPKDKFEGKFVDEWSKFLASEGKADLIKSGIDVGPALSACLAVKDDDELRCTKTAALMTSKLMNVFCDEMTKVVEAEKKTTHEKLTEAIDSRLEDPKLWTKNKPVADFDSAYSDWCYTPIIQSGGDFDLRTSATSNDERLKDKGVILANLGVRYKSYCANMGRTFMIDPHKTQEQNYKFLLELQTFALSQFKSGITLNTIHKKIGEKVAADRSDLVEHLPKTFGFGMGLEFRDSAYSIGPKTTKIVRPGMVFSLSLSLGDIPDPGDKKKTYALQVIDTIKVGSDGGELLTEGLKAMPEMTFYFNDEETKPPVSKAGGKANGSAAGQRRGSAALSAPRKGRLRNEGKETDNEAVQKRKEHQKELAEKRQEEGLAKYAEDDGSGGGNSTKTWKRFESYQREKDLPSAVVKRKILVDISKRSVILPINGFAVPFHINTIKNVVKVEEGEHMVLRFMFVAPGQITGKKEDTPFEDPTATFIRGLSFRNTDAEHISDVYKQITDLKKAVTKREKDKAELADVVTQDNLQEIRGRRPIKMLDISLRPSFDGKRQAGDVEIHQNGIRYQSSLKSEHRVDILFNNIKHIFFQPCDQELIVVLHIHLKAPILVGKKKAKDIQFYREASEAAFDETGNRKRRRQYGDEDEIEAEQDERRKRAELNKHFKAFADKIAEASDGRVEVDIPFRELGFQGVPHRANVLMQPTTDCLVHLIEPPFLVVTLTEVEVAHLERVQYGLKNFDLVFVLKDYSKPPIQINTIPSGQLDNVKEWLDSCDIAFSEGPVNLNWSAIMKTVNEDPYEFFKEGGWSFLGSQDASDEESEESDDAESEFAVSGDSDESSSSDSEGAYSDASASDSGSGSFGDDDSEGQDWSDLEENAAAADKRKADTKKANGGGAAKKGRKQDNNSDVSIDSEEEERKAKKKGGAKKR